MIESLQYQFTSTFPRQQLTTADENVSYLQSDKDFMYCLKFLQQKKLYLHVKKDLNLLNSKFQENYAKLTEPD